MSAQHEGEMNPTQPTPAVARALFSQPGDVVTWGNAQDTNALYRWDGQAWKPLQVGDICRNARDGSAMIWGGPVAGWRKPLVDRSQVDELAAVIDPWAGQNRSDSAHQSLWRAAQEAAVRVLAHGYIHTLKAPEVSPTSYTVPRIPYERGDTVDVVWSNGRTTHHVIEAANPDGSLTLRNRT